MSTEAQLPPTAPKLTKKDFQTDQEVRWCPGCGDYAILKAVQSVSKVRGVPFTAGELEAAILDTLGGLR